MHLVLFLREVALKFFPKAARRNRSGLQAVFFCSPRTTVQRFNFEIGLLSSIHT